MSQFVAMIASKILFFIFHILYKKNGKTATKA